MSILNAASEADVVGIVANARASRRAFAVQGGGTRAALGRTVDAPDILSLANLNGITLYEPAELVIGAKAGTPLAVIKDALASRGQMLPFEPMDHRVLLGTPSAGQIGEPTIGGGYACNISGPRRVTHGAARDSAIGVRFVNGRAEAIKSGGRVMKNVTGLDLVKLSCGAQGTLGVLTEVIFKVLPRPARAATLVVAGLNDADGIALLSKALGSPFEVSGAAHLPAGMGADHARTLLRIENTDVAVTYRLERLRALAKGGDVLDDDATRDLWRDIGDAAMLKPDAAQAIWRVCLPPTNAAGFVASVAASGARHFYDWGGGLVWIAAPTQSTDEAARIRAAAVNAGGYAALLRGADSIAPLHPLADSLMVLTRGIKHSFDPDGLINPGRMYAGV